MLILNHVKKHFANFTLEANLTLPAKKITAFLGPSGSGKTTLINMISGLIQPDSGCITFHDHTFFDSERRLSMPAHQRKIGYVFQDARLFPHYKIKANLTYAMPAHAASQFDILVNLLEIDHLLSRYPHNLSGGEKQRVAIGRALLSQPQLLLMDEPFVSLDLPKRQALLNHIKHLSSQIQTPIIYVSHDLQEIIQLADTIIVINQGQINTTIERHEFSHHPLLQHGHINFRDKID